MILVGTDYWKGLIEWIKDRLIAEKMASEEDLNIFELLDDPEEIVQTVLSFNKV